MFCSNCGKEMQSGEIYCSQCGKKVNDQPKLSLSLKTSNLQGINSILNRLDNDKPVFISVLVLLIISIVLLNKPTLSISYTFFYTHSLEWTLFLDNDFLRYLIIFGYIAAIVMMLLPLLRDEAWSKLHFAGAFVMPLISIIRLGYLLLFAKRILAREELIELVEMLDVSAALNGIGWLFIIASIALVLLAYKAHNDLLITQEIQQKRRREEVYVRDREGTSDNQIKCPKCGLTQEKKGAFCQQCYTPFFKLK